MIQKNRTVFLFWNTGEEKIPLFHKMNIENIRRRLALSNWKVVVTNLNKHSPYYIENFIRLPKYFFKLFDKIKDIKNIPGNQSDIIRLRLLEKYGGCYFDTSTILLKNSIEDIALYDKLIKNPESSLAGYTNYTFTRKDDQGKNYFSDAKDGIELGVLFAKQNSRFLQIFNLAIDEYWNWKKSNYIYFKYPLFEKNKLQKVSFLNEYHIHYTIYHMIITQDPSLLSQITTQSIHMTGKENSFADGPYSIQDRFCRGNSCYEPASPRRLLQALLPGNMLTFDRKNLTLADRIKIFLDADLLVFPGYIRKDLENYFKYTEDYITSPVFSKFYNF